MASSFESSMLPPLTTIAAGVGSEAIFRFQSAPGCAGPGAFHALAVLPPQKSDRLRDLTLRERDDVVQRMPADVERFVVDLTRQPVGERGLVLDLHEAARGERA